MATPARDANGHFLKRNPIPDVGDEQLDSEPVISDATGAIIIDPSALSGERGDGSAGDTGSDAPHGKRGRGRPRKSESERAKPGRKPKQKAPDGLDLSALNALLFSCHTVFSIALKTPELAITEEESERLANATARVAAHYNIAASQKTLDWGNLIIALSVVYGPRIFMAATRKKNDREVVSPDYGVTLAS